MIRSCSVSGSWRWSCQQPSTCGTCLYRLPPARRRGLCTGRSWCDGCGWAGGGQITTQQPSETPQSSERNFSGPIVVVAVARHVGWCCADSRSGFPRASSSACCGTTGADTDLLGVWRWQACFSAWSTTAGVASLGAGRARLQHQGWAGSPLIRNGTVTMLDATPRSFRSSASMRPSLFRSGTTFGASL